MTSLMNLQKIQREVTPFLSSGTMVQSLGGESDVILLSLNVTVGVMILGGCDIVPLSVPDLVQRLSETVLTGQSPSRSSSKSPILTRDKEKRGKNGR